MQLMYNYVLLKMSTWYSKHVEESNNIWRINNIQCITLVVLYGQFMMHGQRNIKLQIATLIIFTALPLFVPTLATNSATTSTRIENKWITELYPSSFASDLTIFKKLLEHHWPCGTVRPFSPAFCVSHKHTNTTADGQTAMQHKPHRRRHFLHRIR